MRKLNCAIVLILSIFTITISAQNISDLEAYEKAMKPGTQLTYDVASKTQKYQLVIVLKKLGAEIAFDWKTTDPDNKSGSVTMSANAVASAEALFNSFTGGETKLDKETCLLISKKVFNKVASTSEAAVKLMGTTDTVTNLSNTIGEFNFNLDGNLMAVPGWELQGGSDVKYTIDVLESTKFPLIYKLDIGWSLILTEVKSL
jgi:hypothetical protein